MQRDEIKKRILQRYDFICLLFAFCFAISVFAIIRTSFILREFYINECGKIAWVRKVVPPGRGTIFDSNETPLAWTERKYDLFVDDISLKSELSRILTLKTGINGSPEESERGLLKRNLSPDELLKIENLTLNIKSKLNIKTRFVRNVVDYPEIKKLIGEAPQENFVGSGLEALYDERLRGEEGIFKVMLDRNRQWIPRTIEWIKEYKNGDDIKLSLPISKLIEGQIPNEISQ